MNSRYPIALLPDSIAVALQENLLQYFAELKFLLLFFDEPWCILVNSSFQYLNRENIDDIANGRSTRTSALGDGGSGLHHLDIVVTDDWHELMQHCRPWYYEVEMRVTDSIPPHPEEGLLQRFELRRSSDNPPSAEDSDEAMMLRLGQSAVREATRILVDVLDMCCEENIPMVWGDVVEVEIAAAYAAHLLEKQQAEPYEEEHASRFRLMQGDQLLREILELKVVNISTVPVYKIIEFRKSNRDLLNSFLVDYRSFLAELESEPLKYRKLVLSKGQKVAESLARINQELLLLRTTKRYGWLNRMSEGFFDAARRGEYTAAWNLLSSPLLLVGGVGEALLSLAAKGTADLLDLEQKEKAMLLKSSSGYLWKAARFFEGDSKA